jgi:glycosyltransferase involved in cell wall biosynthesis
VTYPSSAAAQPSRPRVCFIVTDSLSMVLLGNLPSRMMAAGAEVFVISSPGERLTTESARQGFTAIPVPMHRAVSPFRDVISCLKLIRVMHRTQPDLVYAGTPKAGLLGMVAARINRVPVRIYSLLGMRLETEQGTMRRLLTITERTSGCLASEVLVVSASLREQAIHLKVAPPSKLVVLGAGALRGVDLERFAPTPEVMAELATHRRELGIEPTDPVVGFVGRFSRSKGIAELLDAFDVVRHKHPNAHLVLVGHVDGSEPITTHDQDRLTKTAGVHPVGWTAETPGWFATMDFVVLPTKREGFPSVPLEAAGLMRPCVAFRATGTVDAVVDGETGVLVGQGDVGGLATAMIRYIDDPELRHRHGHAARERVLASFQAEVVQARHVDFLVDHLASAGAPMARNT